jgi:hypothetical protein
MVIKEGQYWIVYNKDKQVVGVYNDKKTADEMDRQINIQIMTREKK